MKLFAAAISAIQLLTPRHLSQQGIGLIKKKRQNSILISEIRCDGFDF